MLRPLPYPDIDRILMLTERTASGQGMSVSWQDFQDWRDQNQAFEHLGIFRGAIVNLTGGDQPERLNGSLTSSAIFGAMRISSLAEIVGVVRHVRHSCIAGEPPFGQVYTPFTQLPLVRAGPPSGHAAHGAHAARAADSRRSYRWVRSQRHAPPACAQHA